MPPDWIQELVSSLQFHSRAAYYCFQRVAHINIQETCAGSIADRTIAQETPHSRTPTVRDSRVLVGCRVKGRSSSAALNHQLFKTLPDLLGSDMYTGAELHVNSEFNPADDPSRRVAVRRPIAPRPRWLDDLQDSAYAFPDHPAGGSFQSAVQLLGPPFSPFVCAPPAPLAWLPPAAVCDRRRGPHSRAASSWSVRPQLH